jgi:hypothetical protein
MAVRSNSIENTREWLFLYGLVIESVFKKMRVSLDSSYLITVFNLK